jgi:hypothetical protein
MQVGQCGKQEAHAEVLCRRRKTVRAIASRVNLPQCSLSRQYLLCSAANLPSRDSELELELIQTQMAQKPMLRADVYARALRASQYVKRAEVWVGARRARWVGRNRCYRGSSIFVQVQL